MAQRDTIRKAKHRGNDNAGSDSESTIPASADRVPICHEANANTRHVIRRPLRATFKQLYHTLDLDAHTHARDHDQSIELLADQPPTKKQKQVRDRPPPDRSSSALNTVTVGSSSSSTLPSAIHNHGNRPLVHVAVSSPRVERSRAGSKVEEKQPTYSNGKEKEKENFKAIDLNVTVSLSSPPVPTLQRDPSASPSSSDSGVHHTIEQLAMTVFKLKETSYVEWSQSDKSRFVEYCWRISCTSHPHAIDDSIPVISEQEFRYTIGSLTAKQLHDALQEYIRLPDGVRKETLRVFAGMLKEQFKQCIV